MESTNFNNRNQFQQYNFVSTHGSGFLSTGVAYNPALNQRSDGSNLSPVVNRSPIGPSNNVFYDNSPNYQQTNNIYHPTSNPNLNQTSLAYNNHPPIYSHTSLN
jgi:hypothetical protein